MVTREYMDENADVLERFGRALVKGLECGQDRDNLEDTLEHAELGNPQQLEDMDFARALMGVYYDLTAATDPEKGYGYMDPAAWERWQETLVNSGDLDAPLPDLTQAYSNQFVEAWNAK